MTTIVSAADAGYFPYLLGLLRSIHEHRLAPTIDISIIDLGLTPEQREEIQPLVRGAAGGVWNIDFPRRSEVRRGFQSVVAKPHLPDYFPDYDLYVWIDADAWLADWRAVELLISGAQAEGLSLVPEIHATYARLYKPSSLTGGNLYRCYAEGWGEKTAREFTPMPVLNAGVFAARRQHPIWETWRTRLRAALQQTIHPTVEQSALNLAIYQERLPMAPLPAWCNWICHQSPPRYNAIGKRFEEPLRPYPPLSIIHAGDWKKRLVPVQNREGQSVQTTLGYLALKEADLI